MHNNDLRAVLITRLRAYHRAMVAGRTDTLAQLLDQDFSLTHITGYVQPMHEWFDVIRTGQFDYHAITIDEDELEVHVTGLAARLSGKGIFDATINGMHAPWRLRFDMHCQKRGGEWLFVSAQYASC